MKTKSPENPGRFSLQTLRKPGAGGACLLLLLGAAQLRPMDAGAVGFRLPNEDPEAIARGNAFAATADNPSAIYYNPAGITQLEGQTASAGLYLISAGDTFESTSGGSAKTKSNFQSVPQFYYVNSPKDFPLSFGLGVYVPYGLSLDWGSNPPFRNVAQNGSLLYATVNPVVAWKIIPSLSLALGPTINYSKADFNRGIMAPNDQFHFVGDDVAFGFNAGIRWQPFEMLAFGVNYRHQTTMDYHGHSSTSPSPPYPASLSSSASLHFPGFVAAGVSFRPTENWNLEVDIDWTDWSSVHDIAFHGIAGGDQNLPLNYRSSLMYEIGATRQLGKGYFASVGYIYSENSSPNQYFDPLIPDGNLHLGNIGFGHRGSRWGWALSYTLAINPGRDVSESIFNSSTTGSMVDGTYRTINHAINISASYKLP